jgi:hypothetical protein
MSGWTVGSAGGRRIDVDAVDDENVGAGGGWMRGMTLGKAARRSTMRTTAGARIVGSSS